MDEPMICTHNNPRVVVGYRAPADLECHYAYADDENENNTIRRLSVNDPSVSDLRMRLGEDATTDWMTQTGHAISKSHLIRRLDCWNDYSDAFETSEDLSNFCKHLAQNRSIQHLTLRHFQHEQLMILAPFFEHNCHHLRCIEISDAGMWKGISPPILNLLKSKSSRLERIDLCDNEISEANAAELINTLNTMPGLHNLLDLCLGGNILCDAACEALCSLLTNPACQIQHLDLRFTCLEDDDLDELVDALTENNTLRSLNLICLDDVTSSGWRRLSSYLSSPNCSLEKIWLGGNRIWDATAAPLRNALVGHRTLKCLDLCMSCFVPRSGCDTFPNA